MTFNRAEYEREYRRRHPEKFKEYRKKYSKRRKENDKRYYEKHKVQILARGKKWRQSNSIHRREQWKLYAQKLKLMVLSHYGGNPPKCACCGEAETIFLTIDHINDDGAKHRKRIKSKAGYGFYRWLIKNNFPKGYQVLCFNCNYAKSQGGCPHKQEVVKCFALV